MRLHSRCAATTLALLLVAAAATAAGDPITVLSSDERALVLRVELPPPDWADLAAAGPWSDTAEPILPGLTLAGAPGAPRVPTAGRWVGLPPGTEAAVTLSDVLWHDFAPRTVAPTPVPVRRVDDDGFPVLAEERLLPGAAPSTGEAVLSSAELADMARKDARPGPLSLGVPTRWRGHDVAALTLRPLDVGADGRAARSLAAATVRIEFRAVAGKETAPRGAPDGHLAPLLLNGDRVAHWPTLREGPVGPVKSTVRKGTLLRPELRIPVTKTRLHRIDAADLSALGLMDLNGVREEHLRLYQRRFDPDGPGIFEEIEVPIHVLGDGGDFSGGESFLFWGLRARDDVAFSDGDGDHPGAGDPHETYNPAADDPVNSGNIYYLAAAEPDAGESWSRMPVLDLPGDGGVLSESYRRTDYHEEDTYHGFYPAGHNTDHNHWNSVRDAEVVRDLDVVNPVAGRSDARLRVGLFGWGTASRNYAVSLVETGETRDLGLLEDADFLGRTYDSQASGVVIQNDWLTGASLRLENMQGSRLYGWLDWFEVEYQAAYAALDDELRFHMGDGAGLRRAEVTGFGAETLQLFDVSDPRAPAFVDLTAANVRDAGDGTWTLSVAAEQVAAGARRFLALAGAPEFSVPDFQYFKISRVDYPDDPTAVVGSPDVLVISHPDFRAEAERWLEHRRARSAAGTEYLLVDSHQLFDWFSGGLKHPDAIKRFVDYGRESWDAWALQIFGDGSQNVRALSAGPEGRDFVPSRWHAWELSGYPSELLPSDNWFVNSAAGLNYPDDTYVPPELLVGRFPCRTAAEAAVMVDKVIAFESAADGEAWKGRLIVAADDAWSSGYQDQGTTQSHQLNEVLFQSSGESMASRWETLGCDVGDWCASGNLSASRIFLGDLLAPHSPPQGETRSFLDMWPLVQQHVIPTAFPRLSAGGMMFRYEGHANDIQMAHERLFCDSEYDGRSDLDQIDNVGRPWIFIGLGCHLATWTEDTVESNPRTWTCLAEKFLLKPGAGAVASYASPGYEFLSNNASFAAVMGNVWLDRPPRNLAGPEGRSRWVLGELLLASQGELLALGTSTFSRRLVSQFALLGDALMVLDVAPPRLQLLQDWEPVADGAELRAKDDSNELVLTLQAFDEAGVDRLEIRDASGGTVSATVTGGTPDGAASDQFASWEIRLPIDAGGGDIHFHVYDTADPDEASPHAVTRIHLPSSVVLYRDGMLYTPGQEALPAGVPLTFSGRLISPAFVPAGAAFAFEGQQVTLSDAEAVRVDEHTVDFDFTVEVDGQEPSLILRIDGEPVSIPLFESNSGIDPVDGGIRDLMLWPNPVRDEASFLFRTADAATEGRILVYSVAGHLVTTIPIRPADFHADGHVRVRWNGRDARGERPANGTYLYRVELDTAAGTTAAAMQRLVLMR